MTFKNKKLILTVTPVIVAITIMITGFANTQQISSNENVEGTWQYSGTSYQLAEASIQQQADPSELEVNFASVENTVQSPEDDLAQGQGVVIISADSNPVGAKRGAVVTIPLTMTYHAGNQDKSIMLQFDRIPGVLYPASLIKSTTPQERLEQTIGGKHLPGAIDLTNFVRVVPAAIKLSDGESTTVNMLVTLPPAFTDEVNNDVLNFSPSFKLAPQDSDQDIAIHIDGVPVRVVGR